MLCTNTECFISIRVSEYHTTQCSVMICPMILTSRLTPRLMLQLTPWLTSWLKSSERNDAWTTVYSTIPLQTWKATGGG